MTSLPTGSGTVELNAAQSFTGDAFDVEPLAAFDIDYSASGNIAYAIGGFTENLYAIDLDNNTMEIVWEDLGGVGDDDIDTIAVDGDVIYVTYTNPDDGNYAIGTVDNSTGDIDFLVDIDPYATPRSLGFFDGDLFVIDGGYGLNDDYTLRSVNAGTGQLTSLYTLDQNIVSVYDGDIDNNGLFRSFTVDNDDITGAVNFDLITNSLTVGPSVSGIDENPTSYWGDPNETVATRGGGNTDGLASTGVNGIAALTATAVAAIAAGFVVVVWRRRSRA